MTLSPLHFLAVIGCILMAGCAYAEPAYGYGDPYDHGAFGVPKGHLPPPGACRVWYDGVPPGQQPPPTDCRSARYDAYHTGGRVIYGSDRYYSERRRDWRECDDRDYYKGEC